MPNKTTLNAALAAALFTTGLGSIAIAGEDIAKTTATTSHECEYESTQEQHARIGKVEYENEAEDENENGKEADDDREDDKEDSHHG